MTAATITDTPLYDVTATTTAQEKTTMQSTTPQPAANVTPPSPIEDAFAFTGDRLDRLEHMLGSMQGTIQRLGRRVEPFLTDGTYGSADAATESTDPTPEDRRSTITRRVSGMGERADHLADFTVRLERELEGILDAMEV